METVTVTEIISIVALKLMSSFLLQIQQQQLKNHEDTTCSAPAVHIVYIPCKHKMCHVRDCMCVHNNRMSSIKCII
jgi:hypothetical protein